MTDRSPPSATTLTDDELQIKSPIVVLSDMHLGHPATLLSKADALLPLVGDAKTVVFNGDTFEHLNLLRSAGAGRMTAELAHQLRRRGVRSLFVAGNHDPRVSTLHALRLFAGKVVITHGDALHPNLAPWSRESAMMRRERQRWLRGREDRLRLDDELFLIKQIATIASLYDTGRPPGWRAQVEMVERFAREPMRVARALHFWSKVPRYAQAFGERYFPRARWLIIGHTHRAGIWRSVDLTLVNTGSYQPLSRPLIVRLTPADCTVLGVRRKGDAYQTDRVILQAPLR